MWNQQLNPIVRVARRSLAAVAMIGLTPLIAGQPAFAGTQPQGEVPADDRVWRTLEEARPAPTPTAEGDDASGEGSGEPVTVPNADFEEGIDHWKGHAATPGDDGKRVREERPDFLEWEREDTAEDSAGALRLTIEGADQVRWSAHQTGAYLTLRQQLPADSRVRVSFDARSLSGSPNLSVMRIWGGSQGKPVVLTPTWQRHSLEVKLDHGTRELVFSFVKNPNRDNIQRTVNGSCLIDNVAIEILDDGSE